MSNSIHQVFRYVCQHRGYKASLGVISSSRLKSNLLAWGAIHSETGEFWVPDLSSARCRWPDAQWTPMNQTQASLFDQAYERETNATSDWLLSL